MMFFNALPGLESEMEQVSRQMEELLPSEWKQGAVGEIIQAILEGRGKGYRPSLLLMMGKLGPDYPSCKDRLYRLGALVEFVHMASLIHDDIIDDSDLRRGKPTIQARFGKEMAVYTGDLILGQVMSILLKDRILESGILLAGTVQDMCRGEIGQDSNAYKMDISEAEYYTNIYGKTASMFVTVCKMAGIESGCDSEVIGRMGEIGLHLGYLFQIRDDLLDFTKESLEDGKPMKMDFQNGILTLPIIYTLQNPACKKDMERLIRLAETGRLSEANLIELDDLILAAGGFEATMKKANEHRDRIKELLSTLPRCKSTETIGHLVAMLKLPKLGSWYSE